MKTVYSGCDTFVFAVKGALPGKVCEHMKARKELAAKEQRDVPLALKGFNQSALIKPQGQKEAMRM